MFGLIADLIASCTSILLPAYLSYKSIRAGDPAQTTPWLIYFVILSLTLLFESWTVFIIGWFPFYSWIRLCFLLYLVLPQTQGAKVLYLTYLEPYIVSHERSIDQFIGETHGQLEKIGLGYLGFIVDYIRDKLLGQASPQQATAHTKPGGGAASGYTGTAGNYAADLLSRFAMPQARTQAAASGGLSSLLSSWVPAPVTGTGGSARSASSETHSAFDISSIQAYLSNPSTSGADKSKVIQNNRDHLNTLLKALDREQQTLDMAYGNAPGLNKKSRSEVSFEQVSYDEAESTPGAGYGPQSSTSPSRHASTQRTTSGGWSSGWFGGSNESGASEPQRRSKEDENLASKGWSAARDVTEAILSSDRDDDRGGAYRR